MNPNKTTLKKKKRVESQQTLSLPSYQPVKHNFKFLRPTISLNSNKQELIIMFLRKKLYWLKKVNFFHLRHDQSNYFDDQCMKFKRQKYRVTKGYFKKIFTEMLRRTSKIFMREEIPSCITKLRSSNCLKTLSLQNCGIASKNLIKKFTKLLPLNIEIHFIDKTLKKN
jgi:hypothetical protein